MRQPVLSDEHQRSIQIRTTPVLSTDHLNLDSALLIPCASLLTVSRTINFLFKVLFIFPSRYLFAIGLVPIFSFRWSLPPFLGCIPKQPDSSKAHRGRPAPPQTGFSPSTTCCSKQLGRNRFRLEDASINYNSAWQATRISNLS